MRIVGLGLGIFGIGDLPQNQKRAGLALQALRLGRDEAALALALADKRIAGAAIDVFPKEPESGAGTRAGGTDEYVAAAYGEELLQLVLRFSRRWAHSDRRVLRGNRMIKPG